MELKEIREKIDLIDFNIIKLLNERMELALRLKKIKKNIYEPEREQEVIKKIKSYSTPLLSENFCENLFCKIIEESRNLQKKNFELIGFQGEHGAYSELAIKYFNKKLISIPFPDFSEVFENVENETIDLGIVPVENSLGGSVTQVNELLINTNLHVVGEVTMRIKHCLLSLPNSKLKDIKIVYSHPQAIAQCRKFLLENKIKPISFYDTAGAAKMLGKERIRDAGVIASKYCAQLYNLKVLKEGIEDYSYNITRFLILSKKKIVKNGDKCSIIFSTQHRAGTLFKVLEIFAKEKINLTRIESIPLLDKTIKYAFFLDFLGSIKEKKVIEVLKRVNGITTMFKFLGCYKSL